MVSAVHAAQTQGGSDRAGGLRRHSSPGLSKGTARMKQMGGRVVLKESHPKPGGQPRAGMLHASSAARASRGLLLLGTWNTAHLLYLCCFLSSSSFRQQSGGEAIHLSTEPIPWMVATENEATTSGNCFVRNPRVSGLSLSWGLSESKSL